MKPQRNYLEVESTLTGEDVHMGIDLASMPHLMNVLTDLYEDRELACIREYSTNAWDANREAGNSEPIRVSLPGALRPLLSVEDNGPGLSAEDIRAIYSQYGASTKRGSDDAVGMLGLGCKSALTYSDQFTLVSVKDGTRTTVSISRDDAGSGVMKILAEEPTDDPNGTTVQIPAKRDNEFAEKAARFFRFWEDGSVLVDGKPPKPLVGLQLSDDMIVMDDEPNDWIVMGNVPYPANLGIYEGYHYGRSAIVARVPIGAVNFTPSRESLMDTDQTQATTAQLRREFEKYAKDGVQRAVDAVATKSEAMYAYVQANAALPPKYRIDADAVTFAGDSLPTFGNIQHGRSIGTSGHKYGLTNSQPDLGIAAKALWITEYENEHWTGTQRSKLQTYLAEHDPDRDANGPICIVGTKFFTGMKWIDKAAVLPWPTVRKWQPPRDPNAPTKARVTGSYNGFRPDDTYVFEAIKAVDLPQDDTVFYVVCKKYGGGGYKDRLRRLRPDEADHLILLPTTRVAKFNRDFPHAREFRAFVREHTEARVKRMTRDELIAAREHGSRWIGLFKALPPDEQHDAELSQVIRWAKAAAKTPNADLDDLLRHYGIDWPKNSETDLFSVCAARYPLLSAVNYRATPADLTLYTNAAYAAESE